MFTPVSFENMKLDLQPMPLSQLERLLHSNGQTSRNEK